MTQSQTHKDIGDGMSFYPEHLSSEELLAVSVQMLTQFAPALKTNNKGKDFHQSLVSLVKAVQDGYQQLVYHNFSHAVDVAHLMYFMVTDEAVTCLDDKQKFYLILTALVHDLGHFGFTNGLLNSDFSECKLTRNYGRQVLESKKQTVMEAFHIEKAHELLDTHEFFARDDVNPNVKDELRVWFTSLILATDLANQDIFLDKVRDDPQGAFHPMADTLAHVQAPSSFCLLLIKLADMGNVFRDYDCAFRWTQFVIAESDSSGAVAKDLIDTTPDPTDINILQSMQKEQNSALQKVEQNMSRDKMEKRMTNFASGFVWPMVLCMKSINNTLFLKLACALKDSLSPAGANSIEFMNKIDIEVL